MKNNTNSLVTVFTSNLIHSIHIAKSLLNSKGIHSFIIDENIISTIGTAFVDGYKLNVKTTDFVIAKQVLSKLESDEA